MIRNKPATTREWDNARTISLRGWASKLVSGEQLYDSTAQQWGDTQKDGQGQIGLIPHVRLTIQGCPKRRSSDLGHSEPQDFSFKLAGSVVPASPTL